MQRFSWPICMEDKMARETKKTSRLIASMQHEALMRERELDNRLFYTRRKLDEAYDTIRYLIRRTGSAHCTRDEIVEILAFAMFTKELESFTFPLIFFVEIAGVSVSQVTVIPTVRTEFNPRWKFRIAFPNKLEVFELL